MAEIIKKNAVVVHSGGMDSSLCLALAKKEYGPSNILSISFNYHQRHSSELEAAKKINKDWGVDHLILDIPFMSQITTNSLVNHKVDIERSGDSPNSLVIGRNGLMARIAAIHAYQLEAKAIYMGVMELEEANSGYRDCSRKFINLIESALRIDFADPHFEIRTPLVQMTKKQTMELADQLGILEYLWENTISCYEGIAKDGCGECPACLLRNQGHREYLEG